MNWKAYLCAGLITFSVVGCGGGGDSDNGGTFTPSINPEREVRSRAEQLTQAIQREDLDGVMSFYSSDYRGPDGINKSQFRSQTRELFDNYDIVGFSTVTERVNVLDANTVQVVVGGRVVLREKDTAQAVTVDVVGRDIWGREGNTWRITESTGVIVP